MGVMWLMKFSFKEIFDLAKFHGFPNECFKCGVSTLAHVETVLLSL